MKISTLTIMKHIILALTGGRFALCRTGLEIIENLVLLHLRRGRNSDILSEHSYYFGHCERRIGF